MANQLKVIKLGLEATVVEARDQGKSLDRIRDTCNEVLEGAGIKDRVSKPAIERYLRSLDAASVAPAHQPQLAERSATLSIDFAERLVALDSRLRKWLDEADAAVTPMRGVLWDPVNQCPAPSREADRHAEELAESLKDALDYMPGDLAAEARQWTAPTTVLIPDWRARTSVAGELRQMLAMYADVMGRIHDAQQVADFQKSILEEIEAAEPEVARNVVRRLATKRDARKAALLGAAA